MRIAAFLAALLIAGTAHAQTVLNIGWCGPVVNTGAAPFAVAEKLGWFAQGGLKVQLVPLPGSSDCVKEVATGDMAYSMPSPEPVAIISLQGVKVRYFYNAYQSNIYGVAVPANSPIQSIADLKGKTVGVTAMSSGGVVVIRSLARDFGLNPDTDFRIVVAGEGGQTAALLRNKQLDALSQFDAAYALVENTGIKLRMLKDNERVAKFPSNGLIALESRLKDHHAEAVALARGIAMGTLFMQTNPEAAVKITFGVYPATKPIGKSDADALADGMRPLMARLHAWDLKTSGATKYGQMVVPNYQAYMDFLLKAGVLKQPVSGAALVSNEVIDEANQFDHDAVIEAAKDYGK